MLVLALSVVIGVVLGLLGAGGSILTTPLFLYVEDMPPVEAIASSLLVVAVASSFALIRHRMRGQIPWRTGLIFGISGMLSAFVGGQVGSHLPSDILLFAFSIIMSVTGFAMIRGRRNVVAQTTTKPRTYRLMLDGALVGFIAGTVGAGGGFMVVPALVILGGLAIKDAIATSLLVVIMNCLGSFAGYTLRFNQGSFISLNSDIKFDFRIILLAIIGASSGSVIGSMFSTRVKDKKLNIAFGWFVILVAAFIFIENLNRAAMH
jgi:uncharacterized membrane protein YfcA